MKQNTRKTLKFFYNHLKRHRLIALMMALALIIGVSASMTWAIVFRRFFNILISGQSKEIIGGLLLSTLIIILLIELVEWIGWRGAQYLNNYFQPRVMSDISDECFEYLQKHSYRFFADNFAGALVKKLLRLAYGFERVADKIYWDLLPMALKIIIIAAVLSWLHPLLGLIMIVWTIIFIAANYWLSLYKLKFDIPRSRQDSKVTGALADAITNSTNIKLFAALKHESARFKKVTESWFQKTKKAWNVGSHIEAGQAAFMILLEFAILFSAIKLWQKDLISIPDFFLIQAYLFEMFHQLWNFGRNLRELYEALADSEEMTLILNTPLEVSDKKGAKRLKATGGRVEFEKVKFSYGKKETVIKNLSFTVKSGEKIALIGPSGGGKSTLVKLLLRLFDVNKGRILIDGQNIAYVRQDSLRENVALVPQDPILFHRTIMENIRYGRRAATDKEVTAAARMANCHEFISRFPDKYRTFVGERGVKLSGGQRQRVAIARAILSNAKILILDEATSSLDSESEKLIQEALDTLIKNKTAFIIAHRLSTIMNTDRIFVLEDGRIIEEGRHSDLVTRKTSLYKKLWDLQVGGYL